MTLAAAAFSRSPKPGNRRLPAVCLAIALLGLSCTSAVAQQASGDTAELNARIEQLEQQLVEMQVTIGTLESLAKSARVATPARGVGGGDVSQLEIQVRAMSGQIAELSREVRALQQGSFSAGRVTNNSYTQPAAPLAPRSFEQAAAAPRGTFDTSGDASGNTGGFGSVTVTPEVGGATAATPPVTVQRDPIGSILSEGDVATNQRQTASLTLSPRQAYDRAYGYLLDENFGAAENAFAEFVRNHPSDKLAGNAQYWLGESHYVREDYRSAAKAFLKGYKQYSGGAKASDSLLKLAMSLSRLGYKPRACATFDELTAKFPKAPAHVTRRVAAERQRAGCRT
ncbi:MAG: tol-pal system protein YbgF [Pseudomonadota bacterium]